MPCDWVRSRGARVRSDCGCSSSLGSEKSEKIGFQALGVARWDMGLFCFHWSKDPKLWGNDIKSAEKRVKLVGDL